MITECRRKSCKFYDTGCQLAKDAIMQVSSCSINFIPTIRTSTKCSSYKYQRKK